MTEPIDDEPARRSPNRQPWRQRNQPPRGLPCDTQLQLADLVLDLGHRGERRLQLADTSPPPPTRPQPRHGGHRRQLAGLGPTISAAATITGASAPTSAAAISAAVAGG